VRDYAATLNDPAKRAVAGEALTAQEGPSAEALAKAGMAAMSKKFLDLGGEVYVDEAVAAKESNKAL
jgi:phosphomethylpyrimidine synthase